MRSASVAAASLLFAGGCLPIPHRYQDLPRVEGTITSGGAPVANAGVGVADVTRANPCVAPEQAAVTGVDGRFEIAGRRRIRLFFGLLIMGHSTDTYAIAVTRDGTPAGYIRPFHYRAGPRYAPEQVDLVCDIDARNCELHDRSWNYRRTLTLKPCDEFSSEPR